MTPAATLRAAADDAPPTVRPFLLAEAAWADTLPADEAPWPHPDCACRDCYRLACSLAIADRVLRRAA